MTLLAKFNLPPALAKWQVEFMRSYQLVAGDLVMSLMLDMAEHRGGLVRQGAVVEMLELVANTSQNVHLKNWRARTFHVNIVAACSQNGVLQSAPA